MAEVETYYVHPNWAWQKGKPSEKWIDERCIGFVKKSDHDAALRRAKAEGVREARARIEHAFEHGDIVQDVLDDLDARAAQIEEGDK